jgi:hypothetical protein
LLEVAVADGVPAPSSERSAARLATMAEVSDGRMALVVVDAAGAELARHPIANLSPPHEEEEIGSAFTIVEFLPVPDGAAGVRLVLGEAAVDQRVASAGPPTVSIVEPSAGSEQAGDVTVRWEASDPDGDALRFDLLHSTDGGRTWQTIARQVTGTSRVVPAGSLAGSGRSRIKVVAHDGFHTASAESATFTTPNTPPRLALITSPADGATFPRRDLVTFRGRASDAEDDGNVVDDLRWRSSRDGDLGRGPSVQTRDLSAGTHTVTLTAVDTDGARTTRSITVVIDGSREADAPDDETIARGLDLIADHRDGDGGFPFAVVAAALVVVAALAGGLALRRRRG